MQNLKVTMVQADLAWEDPEKNLSQFDDHLRGLEATDLVVLPEMFSTGFSMDAPRLAEKMDGPSSTWLREKVRELNVDMMGSLIIEENGHYYNRMIWVRPDGEEFTYDKVHLFRMAKEDETYSGGTENITIDLNGWKIRPFICYDLRFPVWNRNVDEAYDLAVFIANWPEKRSHHWKSLLLARSIENLAYVIGVNRVGTDGKGHTYSGDTSAFTPRGETLFQASHREIVHTVTLSKKDLVAYREQFPAWKDADRFEVRPRQEVSS